MSKARIILASASPRRAELLRRAGINFEIKISPHKEPHRKPAGIPIELWPTCLAYIKARAVQHQITNQKSKINNAIILAADTIVVEGTRIINKPRNRHHAKQILSSLHNKLHRVITGVCLLSADGKHQRLFSCTATCRLHLTGKKLDAYLDSNLWKGKAGAYGIQDKWHGRPARVPSLRTQDSGFRTSADPFVTLIDGDIDTVIGLPTALVKRELADFTRLLNNSHL